VDTVRNGTEAVAAATKREYALIFMDIQMPGMDGLEAARLIRSLASGMKKPAIIAVSANVRPEMQQLCLDSGMKGFIRKPYRVQEIHDALKQAVRSSRA
jgi:CheY-like chemotaxis protein